MFAVNRILRENSKGFSLVLCILQVLNVPTHKHSEGLEILQMPIFLNNKLLSSQKILPLEDSIQTEDDKGN